MEMESSVRTDMIETLNQKRTPLSDLYFSDFNIDLIQRALRQHVKNETGLAVDRQNQNDLMVFMRTVYINNALLPHKELCEQVKWMNSKVIEIASRQVISGVSAYIDYLRDASTLYVPNAIPENTSLYGKKIDINTKIGL
jgi:hypothetical protein